GYAQEIAYRGWRVYSTLGTVIDPTNLATAPALTGTVAGGSVGPIAIDAANSRLYGIRGPSLVSFDTTTFVQVGSALISGMNGTPSSLIRWGVDGLALRTSADQVFILHVPPT